MIIIDRKDYPRDYCHNWDIVYFRLIWDMSVFNYLPGSKTF